MPHGARRSGGQVDITWIQGSSVRTASVSELPDLLSRDDGFVWLDLAAADDVAQRLLTQLLRFHPRAVQDCLVRNHMPKLHVYPDHLFLVLHSPEPGRGGHVHYLELDQFLGERYLVTVHGPLNPVVPLETSMRETLAVRERVVSGRLVPSHPVDLSYAIVTAIVRHEEELVGGLAQEVGLLEQSVMAGVDEAPLSFLERLYQARHQLLTVRTMASQTHEVYGRACRLATSVPPERRHLLEDVFDQYGRIYRITDGQLGFIQGVTEFYRARTDTKMTIAAERLAVIAALTLPVTALSSVLGMNLIVNGGTLWPELLAVVTLMSATSLWLLRWAKKQGWW
jgi:Mg2+ and Co2+ transporter CorA